MLLKPAAKAMPSLRSINRAKHPPFVILACGFSFDYGGGSLFETVDWYLEELLWCVAASA